MPFASPPPALRLATMHDAVIVPTPRDWPVGPVVGGVIDADGRVAPDTLLYRNFSQVVFAPPPPSAPQETIDEPHIYAGFCIDHFGHFLLEGLSRAWASAERADLPLVWATPGGPKSWQKAVCDLLGFGDRMRFVDRPTRFRTLLVPDPGYRIRDYMHPDHARFLGRFAPDAAPDAGLGPRLWLSRRGLAPAGRIGGEDALEAALERLGWQVARPEALDVTAQLSLLARASAVGGVEGSALHMPILLRAMAAPLIVARRIHNENYRTIAAARGFEQHDLVGSMVHAAGADGVALRFQSPARSAELIDAIAAAHGARAAAGERLHPGDLPRLTVHQDDNRLFAPDATRPAPPGLRQAARDLAGAAARALARRLPRGG
jgi:hypothetical protein